MKKRVARILFSRSRMGSNLPLTRLAAVAGRFATIQGGSHAQGARLILSAKSSTKMASSWPFTVRNSARFQMTNHATASLRHLKLSSRQREIQGLDCAGQRSATSRVLGAHNPDRKNAQLAKGSTPEKQSAELMGRAAEDRGLVCKRSSE